MGVKTGHTHELKPSTYKRLPFLLTELILHDCPVPIATLHRAFPDMHPVEIRRGLHVMQVEYSVVLCSSWEGHWYTGKMWMAEDMPEEDMQLVPASPKVWRQERTKAQANPIHAPKRPKSLE